MLPYLSITGEALLVALYLPGLERPVTVVRARWPGILSAFHQGGGRLEDAPAILRRSGYRAEALVLECPGLLAHAEVLASKGAVLTTASAGYPVRWLRVLGNPPPALWMEGEWPPGEPLAVVGSRHVGRTALEFAAEVGLEAQRLGWVVVSGGALGCDRAALARVSCGIEILPCGMSRHRSRHCRLSARPPEEGFSVAGAMERNALIYASASHTVVVHARYKRGGAWTGAIDAIRRRYSNILVGFLSEESAFRALVALGGTPLRTPQELEAALTPRECQPMLSAENGESGESPSLLG